MHLDAEQLALSSGKWMATAFAAFADGPSSEDMAVHHAGVATEHLLKAFLAKIHPSLIVDGKDFNSMLYAAGRGSLLQVRGSQVKTIQLGEAYERAQKILKGKIPLRPKGPWPLADARNGVAHSGYHDRAEVVAVFTSCIKVIDPLLAELGIGPEYWGQHKELHDKLLIEGIEAARVRSERKLSRARRIFQQRYGHISDTDLHYIVATSIGLTAPWNVRHAHTAPCPACSLQGLLTGSFSIDEERQTVVLSPESFRCSVCELHLELEELDMLRIPLAGSHLHVPIAELFDDYDPEEGFPSLSEIVAQIYPA
ncbi:MULTISPECIES: hypothetical protein [unclassified Streptomyces]|uniref:hypothetical protein n=1 Tax=unclassified Streptomyces TaxID=2593676 RepID=UPI00093A496F|nr:hypothetical protein [Streptomyces sp. CB02058]